MKSIALVIFGVSIATLALQAHTQEPASQEARRAAITVLRAINTAENAVKQQTGKYVPMAALLDHPMMGKVKPNISINGGAFMHAGAEVRIALSADAMQYVVTVMTGAPAYTAAFTDERGVIYTGQALQ